MVVVSCVLNVRGRPSLLYNISVQDDPLIGELDESLNKSFKQETKES